MNKPRKIWMVLSIAPVFALITAIIVIYSYNFSPYAEGVRIQGLSQNDLRFQAITIGLLAVISVVINILSAVKTVKAFRLISTILAVLVSLVATISFWSAIDPTAGV